MKNQHMIYQVIKKKNLFPFLENLLDAYLKSKTHNEK
jgi:hypothetical protein